MRTIVAVDDVGKSLEAIREAIQRRFRDECVLHDLTEQLTRGQLDKRVQQQLNSASIALVDIELRGDVEETEGAGPADFDGRDVILPTIRQHAPWLPVVACTKHAGTDARFLAEITPYQFDAIVSKRFFNKKQDRLVGSDDWQALCYRASLARNSALLGVTFQEAELRFRSKVRLEYGNGVRHLLASFSDEQLIDVFSLLDLGSTEVVLQEIVQGFSGVAVLKAIAADSPRRPQWLVKLGSSLGKIFGESRRHSNLRKEGISRHLTVPMLNSNPVVWDGVAAIAYEFESGASTLSSVRLSGV